MKKEVVGCSASEGLARSIARKLGCGFSSLDTRKFPDGETNLRLTKDVRGEEVYLVQSLYDPNDKLIEAFFAAGAAKELGAKKVFLIAPYLCYMRQDKRFRPYEAVSSRIMASMVSSFFDGIITVDPHLHRYRSLKQIFRIKDRTLTADSLIADYIKKNIRSPLIIGPDAESYQWAKDVAKMVGCRAMVLKKKRYTARHVAVKIRQKTDLSDKGVVIIDDVISTGHTMAEVVKDAKRLGARRVYCICVHSLFAEGSYERLAKLGAKIISCNTIPHKTNKIDVSGLIAQNLFV